MLFSCLSKSSLVVSSLSVSCLVVLLSSITSFASFLISPSSSLLFSAHLLSQLKLLHPFASVSSRCALCLSPQCSSFYFSLLSALTPAPSCSAESAQCAPAASARRLAVCRARLCDVRKWSAPRRLRLCRRFCVVGRAFVAGGERAPQSHPLAVARGHFCVALSSAH